MKKVLIIDSHIQFREFLKQKLTDDQIEVVIMQDNRDLYTSMTSVFPDLIILDLTEDSTEEMEFLEKKADDFTVSRIPIVVTGTSLSKSYTASLAKYGVVKYFAKPVQFDIFFESIGKILHTPLSIDSTPSIMDIHRNKDLIFIELAQALNRDKISLLRFRLTDIIQKEELESPKIILMITGLDLNFTDGYNLEYLFDNILACPNVSGKNVKLLSFSPFLKDFLDGHPDYSQFEMSPDLTNILNDVVDTTYTSSVSDLITDKVILPSNEFETSTAPVDTRFFTDSNEKTSSGIKQASLLNIAIVDADLKSTAFLKQVLEDIGSNVFCFTSSKDFIENYQNDKFTLVILDVILPDQTGFSLLQHIQKQIKAPPILVYSQNLPKESVKKILLAGAKAFMIKPQKPNDITQKIFSILNQ
ncbi:MAG: response regulator [Treponema sp.]|nr:response regulator [Treponema sp.]